MIITLNADWRINVELPNHALERRTVAGERSKNPGAESWATEGHYWTLQQAALAAVQKMAVRGGDATSAQAVVASIEAASKNIRAALRGVGAAQ